MINLILDLEEKRALICALHERVELLARMPEASNFDVTGLEVNSTIWCEYFKCDYPSYYWEYQRLRTIIKKLEVNHG